MTCETLPADPAYGVMTVARPSRQAQRLQCNNGPAPPVRAVARTARR